MKLSECLPNILNAETIEKKAINLLNHSAALVLSPTTQVTAEKEKGTQEIYSRNLQNNYFRKIFGKM